MGQCLVYVWIQQCFAGTCPAHAREHTHIHTHAHTTFVSRSEEFWGKGTVAQFASARKMLPRGLGRLLTQLLTTHPSSKSLVPSMQVFGLQRRERRLLGNTQAAEVPGLFPVSVNDL